MDYSVCTFYVCLYYFCVVYHNTICGVYFNFTTLYCLCRS